MLQEPKSVTTTSLLFFLPSLSKTIAQIRDVEAKLVVPVLVVDRLVALRAAVQVQELATAIDAEVEMADDARHVVARLGLVHKGVAARALASLPRLVGLLGRTLCRDGQLGVGGPAHVFCCTLRTDSDTAGEACLRAAVVARGRGSAVGFGGRTEKVGATAVCAVDAASWRRGEFVVASGCFFRQFCVAQDDRFECRYGDSVFGAEGWDEGEAGAPGVLHQLSQAGHAAFAVCTAVLALAEGVQLVVDLVHADVADIALGGGCCHVCKVRIGVLIVLLVRSFGKGECDCVLESMCRCGESNDFSCHGGGESREMNHNTTSEGRTRGEQGARDDIISWRCSAMERDQVAAHSLTYLEVEPILSMKQDRT